MLLIDKIAEARVSEAIERGEFDDLPGAGQPLVLDDDRHVPEELRAGYRMLKNAGYLPPELELRREIHEVEQLLDTVTDPGAHAAASKRLRYLMTQLSLTTRGCKVDLRSESAYYEKMLDRMNNDCDRMNI